MTSPIIIISFGPAQLLSQVALLKQLNRLSDVVGLISYVSQSPNVISFDKKICKIFRIEYLGDISNFNNIIKEFGVSDLRAVCRSFFQRDLVNRLRKWLLFEAVPVLRGEKYELVVAHRDNLVSDDLLIRALCPLRVFMVCDGFFMTLSANLMKRILSFLITGRRLINRDCLVFSPSYFPDLGGNDKERGILLEPLSWCYQRVLEVFSDSYNRFLGDSIGEFSSILLWQNLFPGFINNEATFLEFYKQVLKSEAAAGDGKILVKPHPRSSVCQLSTLRENCPVELRDKVVFLDDDELLAVPVEILLSRFRCKRVAGMASTGLWAASKLFNVRVTLYSCHQFSRRLKKEIIRFASTIGAPVSYL